MSDADLNTNLELVRRFAALVALLADQPAAAVEHRDAARGVVESAKTGAVRLAIGENGLLVDDVPFDSPLLAGRFGAYGVEQLAITERVALADVLDLARLLAAPPTDADPAARFAARVSVVDAKAMPRRLRPRSTAPAPEPPRRTTPLPPQSRVSSKVAVVAESPADPTARTSAPTVAIDTPASRDEPEHLIQAIPVPTPSHPALASAIDGIDQAKSPPELATGLEQLVLVADLAFRQGRLDDLIEAATALVAIEFRELERDGSDERRQAFTHALRKLAKPVLLRQLAVLRHKRAADPVASARLQQVLYRFGNDGAEALVDEFVSSATPEARATCIEALRGIRRTHDVLLALARDTRDLVVRQAAAILGEMRDARAESILIELLQHPDARTRRASVSSLALFESTSALDAIGFSLGDESPIVRLRAVAALQGRRDPRVLALLSPLLEKEPDREVLYSAIVAVGAVGSPDAVQLLIRLAEGEGLHPLRKLAATRLQACIALVAIRSPTSMAAVQVLRSDRDSEVREASVRLVAQAQRRSTSSVAVVNEP